MAKNRQIYWTPDRLKELAKLWPKKTLPQLEKHFGKKPDDIIQAHEFQRMNNILFKKKRLEKGIMVTYYHPATAELATQYDSLVPQ